MKIERLICISFLLHVATVQALGLGEVQGRTQIGQPLSIRIPLQGSDGRAIAADCVAVVPVATDGGLDTALVGSRVLVDSASPTPSLVIVSREALTQPVIKFQVSIGCGFQLTRDYQLLPGPPASMPVVAPRSVPALASAPADGHVLEHAITLRLLSRQRYPGDSSARVRFIQRTARANPELFPSIEAAYDQTLPAGTRLRLPPLPSPPAAGSAAAVRPPAAAKVALPRAEAGSGKGGGRLVIGRTESLPAPTAAELEASMDRLINVMNEQMTVQITMAERIKRLESEIDAAKRNVMAQQAINRKLEEDIRQLREDQTRASYIQLVLAILLGGFAGAALLRWKGKRAGRDSIDDQLLDRRAATPAPKPRPPAKPAPLQSVFDDLLPPR